MNYFSPTTQRISALATTIQYDFEEQLPRGQADADDSGVLSDGETGPCGQEVSAALGPPSSTQDLLGPAYLLGPDCRLQDAADFNSCRLEDLRTHRCAPALPFLLKTAHGRLPMEPLDAKAAQMRMGAAANTRHLAGTSRGSANWHTCANRKSTSCASARVPAITPATIAAGDIKLATTRLTELEELRSERLAVCPGHELLKDVPPSARPGSTWRGQHSHHHSSQGSPRAALNVQPSKLRESWSAIAAARWLEGNQSLSARSRVLAEAKLNNSTAVKLQHLEDVVHV